MNLEDDLLVRALAAAGRSEHEAADPDHFLQALRSMQADNEQAHRIADLANSALTDEGDQTEEQGGSESKQPSDALLPPLPLDLPRRQGLLPPWLVTPGQVHDRKFTTVRLRQGYDEVEVDDFLDEVENTVSYLTETCQTLLAENVAARRAAEWDDAASPPGEGHQPKPWLGGMLVPPPPAPTMPAPLRTPLPQPPGWPRSASESGGHRGGARSRAQALEQEAAEYLLSNARREAEDILEDAMRRAEAILAHARGYAEAVQDRGGSRLGEREQQLLDAPSVAENQQKMAAVQAMEREMKAFLENQLLQLSALRKRAAGPVGLSQSQAAVPALAPSVPEGDTADPEA